MKYIFKSIACLSLLITFNSCKHDNFKEHVGPAACPSESFAVKSHLNVSSTSLDFTKQVGDTITASFSEAVSWTITIKGQTSGAKKVYTGNSDTVSVVWQGQPGHFGLPGDYIFFTSGEDVTVELTIPCRESEIKTIKLVKESNFTTFGKVVSDFDGAGYIANTTQLPGYSATGWSSYFTLPNKIEKFAVVSGPLTAPKGPKYLTVVGTAGPKSWFVGGLYVNAPTNMPSADPNDVYFNAFITSGSNTATLLGITLIADGIKYSKNVSLNWKGWRMVSVKLSDFKSAAGKSMTDATKVVTIDMGLNPASAQGQTTEANLDFIIFTSGGPFFQ